MKKKGNKKGFTLVEMLVSIAIFAVIGSIVSIFIFQGFILYRNELESNEDESNVRNAVTYMVNTMRKTTVGNISVAENVLTVDGKSYSFDGANLLLNETTLVKGISAYSVTMTNYVIDISITTAKGRTINTSYGIRQ